MQIGDSGPDARQSAPSDALTAFADALELAPKTAPTGTADPHVSGAQSAKLGPFGIHRGLGNAVPGPLLHTRQCAEVG
jgi:hypothetical protein